VETPARSNDKTKRQLNRATSCAAYSTAASKFLVEISNLRDATIDGKILLLTSVFKLPIKMSSEVGACHQIYRFPRQQTFRQRGFGRNWQAKRLDSTIHFDG
jgi:hypothetical protein